MTSLRRSESTHPWPTLDITREDNKLTDAQLEDIAHLEQEHFETGFRQRDATHMTLYYYGKELIGKLEYHYESNGIHVDWFLAPGYGKVCWDLFIKKWTQGALIHLVCVADPNESTETVLRRFNFYTNTVGDFHFKDVQYEKTGAVKFMLSKRVE
jgi:hypothetical protein